MVYRTLDEAVDELRARMGGLPAPDEAEDIWRSIWFEETHNSTAIEGNTLVLRQVEALLADGRVVGRKHIAEYLEVRGYAEAATWVYRQALGAGEWSGGKLITLTEVRRVHQMAMALAWNASPHPEATTPRDLAGSDATTSGRLPAVCAYRPGPRSMHRCATGSSTPAGSSEVADTSSNALPLCTARSSGSTRSSTATVGPGV